MGCGCNKNKAAQPATIQSQQPAMPQAIPESGRPMQTPRVVSSITPTMPPNSPNMAPNARMVNSPTANTAAPAHAVNSTSTQQRPPSYYQPVVNHQQPSPNVVGAWGPQRPTANVGPLGPQRAGEPINIPPLPQAQHQPRQTSGLSQTVNAPSTPQETKKPYSVLDAAIDTAKAAFGKEGVFAPEDVRQKRANICDACPHKKMARCTICGCVLDLKVRYEQSSCPINKW